MGVTLEFSLKFVASPCEIWKTGKIKLGGTMLEQAFAYGLICQRKEGEVPKVTCTFKALNKRPTANVESGTLQMA